MTAAQQSRLMKRLRETYDWCLGLAWGNAIASRRRKINFRLVFCVRNAHGKSCTRV